MAQFRKSKNNVWFHIPETWILVWRGSRYERGLIALLMLIILLSSSYFWGRYSDEKERLKEYLSALSIPNPFAGISLEAEVAYVIDVETGELLYGLHEERSVPIASITKIMTALVALEILPEGEVITMPKVALEEAGDNGLYWNEEWLLSDLIEFMLIGSSNDAAQAIALAVEEKLGDNFNESPELFIVRMNEKAREIGLTKTKFLSVTGLDISSTEAGAYGSAKDTALLAAYALKHHPEIFKVTANQTASFTSLSGFTHIIENTNPTLGVLPNVISSKTGLTQLAGGNLVVAIQNGSHNPFIISVLGSSESGRFSDIEKLISASAMFIKAQKY